MPDNGKTTNDGNSGKRFYVHTFGCQMNVHDSEKISGILSGSGYVEADGVKDADVIVINTCSIREKAEQKFYSELGRLKDLKDKSPDLKIAVAGCIAQQKGKAIFKRFPYVDFIFGPGNIDNLEKWIKNWGQGAGGSGQETEDKTPTTDNRQFKAALGHNPEYHLKKLPVNRAGQVRAWLSIMYGCDNFCSYCVVPYTRGREISRPYNDILNEVRTLANGGFKEVTLLGQNVNSYGKNLHDGIDFPDLLKVIHEVHGIGRIRFVTSHPKDLSFKLIDAMKQLPNICEHIHLPLQSGSDRILALMNRGYTCDEYKEKINALRNAIPDIALTTDIIAGFPGETDEDFKNTMSALEEIGFDGIFSFKYSKRPDTKALSLPSHVKETTKSERLAEILNLQADITYKNNKELEGRTVEVLVEGISEMDRDKLTGRTRTNKIVNFHGHEGHIGKFIMIKILEAKQHSLSGEIV